MDMEQRTRFISGRAGGRIILLGDGTEISIGNSQDDDGDVDMESRGEIEEIGDDDAEGQVSSTADESADDRNRREETPAPSVASAQDSVSSEPTESDSASSTSAATSNSTSVSKDATISATTQAEQ